MVDFVGFFVVTVELRNFSFFLFPFFQTAKSDI